ncbi:type 1 glutamine amidotransferase domain-containing protein [Paenisporosarcina antarctica]|uniref:Type 1 glutamine amidotransferase domain-containing protein n=1 Tax=Paenisporosarcina antarctica TaxID=417367 RepID=A0A4P7A193_9BACL|nr:type 1 glutamine amidotransferase domain-containing protein [Paenisporosarcina antarctica]QBP42374.1 type 1 glutamine amidotransferase domain-containing protein [Paenisporosarcina antarctica]
MTKKILMVLTSTDKMGEDNPTGTWLSEFADAYLAFKKQGYDVTVSSILGGKAPVDPASIDENTPQEILDAEKYLANTVSIEEVEMGEHEVIFLPGGHGTMFDFPENKKLQSLLREFYEADKYVVSVCHGPAGLVGATLSNGQPLVKGKRVSGFTDAEERETTLDSLMPFLLESKLRELGATVETVPNWSEHSVVDGKLITGQNPQSTPLVVKELLKKI